MCYEINGQVYHQRELVLGQVRQLLTELSGVRFGALTVEGVIDALGDRIYRVVAVVLIPEGVAIKERDLDAIASDLEEAPARVLLQVVADFFGCNQLSLLQGVLEDLNGQVERSTGMLLKRSSASLPTATSASGTPSSGG